MTTEFQDVPTITHGDKVTWSLDDEGNIVIRSHYGPGVGLYFEPQDVGAMQSAQDAHQAVAFIRANAPTKENQIEIDLSPSLNDLEAAFIDVVARDQ